MGSPAVRRLCAVARTRSSPQTPPRGWRTTSHRAATPSASIVATSIAAAFSAATLTLTTIAAAFSAATLTLTTTTPTAPAGLTASDTATATHSVSHNTDTATLATTTLTTTLAATTLTATIANPIVPDTERIRPSPRLHRRTNPGRHNHTRPPQTALGPALRGTLSGGAPPPPSKKWRWLRLGMLRWLRDGAGRRRHRRGP